MKAIYQKEMRQYFHSVIGYVFLAIFVFINAYYFLLQNLLNRSGDITDYFQSTITLMMFLMPMLTMTRGGISKRIVDFAYSVLGRFKGGLGYVGILASMVPMVPQVSTKLTSFGEATLVCKEPRVMIEV